LLFAIYVNDLPDIAQSFMFCLLTTPNCFAVLYVSDLDVAQLQADIDSFLIWSKDWLLNLCISKCKCRRIEISNCSSHCYLINGESLCTTTEKDLGVVIDQNLKFHQQAAAAAAKVNVNCTLGLISKCFEHLDIDTLPLLYKTLMHPIWNMQMLYCITDQKLLERDQNRATRRILSLWERTYVERLSHLQFLSRCYRRN